MVSFIDLFVHVINFMLLIIYCTSLYRTTLKYLSVVQFIPQFKTVEPAVLNGWSSKLMTSPVRCPVSILIYTTKTFITIPSIGATLKPLHAIRSGRQRALAPCDQLNPHNSSNKLGRQKSIPVTIVINSAITPCRQSRETAPSPSAEFDFNPNLKCDNRRHEVMQQLKLMF